MLLAIVLSVLLMSPALVAETIRVLILDGTFSHMPEDEGKLRMLDAVNGELLVGYTRYKGNISVWKDGRGLYLVSELPLEEYIEGVVSSEISEAWEIEAIKAQAVVARTYALAKKLGGKDRKFHVTSTVNHQVFKGNNDPDNIRVSYGVKSTAGEILTFKGEPIEAFYHSTCGGMTEDPQEVFDKSYPYLKPMRSECTLSPYLSWSRSIPIAEIESALGLKGIKDIKIKSRTASGRAKELTVITGSNMTISAVALRKRLGWKRLPSTDFTIKANGNSMLFEGKGYGHGVGLCQWGALEMAKKGSTYREILAFYYPDTTIELYEAKGF